MNKWYQEIIVLNKEIDGSMFYCFDEENYKKISDEREEQLKEIERLNNIISELENFICDLEIECNIDNSMWGVAVIIHNKLKELKGSDKE